MNPVVINLSSEETRINSSLNNLSVSPSSNPVTVRDTQNNVVRISNNAHSVDVDDTTVVVRIITAAYSTGGSGAGSDFETLDDVPDGTSYKKIPPGSVTGDIPRWNSTTGTWEVATQPFAFTGIVLTPALAALSNVEGGMFYNSVTKTVEVCTDAI